MSNLMVCNLAYSGKLEELKERILADKSLATRTDQVKPCWSVSSGGGGGGEVQRGGPAQAEAGSARARSPPPLPPPPPGVTSGLGIRRQGLAPQTSNIFWPSI